ncbi:endoplasmic reticulum-Golgi intermediate compartment protein 2 isoform X2 [Stegostoma tigrinum]|uniref:endoplasmic reticulum-Golgi intermediate compartment protein 2 isoform X2 n=1 Tax=Stegostoma tigrinum TaxID=3053191 RepID=UPI00202B1431|nr:endoplasmic reticulum-Golgi intermediate compartment protein 2 isoform X2 [Stegostoma tigrinum]
MRRLNKKRALNLVKELDAFPKIPESYIETSTSGGTVSIIAFTTIALLSVMEFFVYCDTWMKYDYEVDKDFASKLRINLDITVSMKCHYIGADVLDLAETMVAASEGLKYEPTVFELSSRQRVWQRTLQTIRKKVQEEHSLQDLLFKSAFKGSPTVLPPRAIPHPRGHAHMAALISHDVYNFSHRIDHYSFGEPIPGLINPLDGTEKIAIDHNQMFQYFITIVPTKLNTYKFSADTHQYSVTERERVINHATGSHGVSGIFIKYDISSLMVTVTEQHMPLGQFLVRLCGIVGGIFSTTGMLHGFVGFFVDIICCRFRLGAYKPKSVPTLDGHMNNHSLPILDDVEH